MQDTKKGHSDFIQAIPAEKILKMCKGWYLQKFNYRKALYCSETACLQLLLNLSFRSNLSSYTTILPLIHQGDRHRLNNLDCNMKNLNKYLSSTWKLYKEVERRARPFNELRSRHQIMKVLAEWAKMHLVQKDTADIEHSL